MLKFTFFKTKVLIVLIAGLAIALYIAKDYWTYSISIISGITAIIFIINKWLWRFWPFKYMFWVRDFSGRYEGDLEYEYIDKKNVVKKGVLKHVKIIHQTGSYICVYSYNITPEGHQSSYSQSIGVHVDKMQDDMHYQLIYSYRNEGNAELKYATHYGTEIINIIQKGKEKVLSGRYFTERLPYQTKGRFKNLRKTSNNLNHEF